MEMNTTPTTFASELTNFASYLARDIFREICNENGYDLHEEDESGILDDTFWTWLCEFCSVSAEGCEVTPSYVLTTTAKAFATSLDSRIMLMETYAMKLMMDLEMKAKA